MVDLIISAIASLAGAAMDGFVKMILPVISFDFSAFAHTFPFAAVAYNILRSCAIGIVLLLAALQVFPYLTGSNRVQRTSPFRILLFSAAAIVGIFYGNYILESLMEIAQTPYNALLNANVGISGTGLKDISLGAVFSIAHDLAYKVSIPVYIFLICSIGIAFIKLLLEAVERYVILFVLVYLSPLASSTIASESTIGIFKKYISMFIAQCILLILNVWSLRMINSFFVNMAAQANPMFGLLLGYAFLRVASRFDSYLNSLGLSAAITGSGLGAELMASGMTMMASLHQMSGSGNYKYGGMENKNSSILGGLTDAAPKVSPISAAAMGIGAEGKAFGNAAKQAFADSNGDIDAFQKSLRENFKKNHQAANLEREGISKAFFGRSATDQVVASAMHGNGISDEDFRNITQFNHVADQAFDSQTDSSEVADPTAVGAVMKGIGMDYIPDGENAAQAIMGATAADDVTAVLNNNGIHASYSQNGKTHEWDIKNQSQYNALSPVEQQAYSSFRNRNGTTYYAKHNVSQAPTEIQKDIEAAASSVAMFTQNPQANPIPRSHMQTVSGFGKNNMADKLYDGFAENLTGVTLDQNNSGTCVDMLRTNATILKDAGVSNNVIKNAEMALENTQDHNVSTFECNSNGMNIVFTDQSGLNHQIILRTQDGVAADMKKSNFDKESYISNLDNKGYHPSTLNGKKYYVLHKEISNKLDEIDRDAQIEYL